MPRSVPHALLHHDPKQIRQEHAEAYGRDYQMDYEANPHTEYASHAGVTASSSRPETNQRHDMKLLNTTPTRLHEAMQ
jgi:hypothetical protein